MDAEYFNSPDCVNLFCTNADVQKYNYKCLTIIGNPITLIEATHTGKGQQFKLELARSLETSLYLSFRSNIFLTNNNCQLAGVCNEST
eukprot:10968526-Ditylum_brightwellii.AAC.1